MEQTVLSLSGFIFSGVSLIDLHLYKTTRNEGLDNHINEPRHDKTCIREFPTRTDTDRPAQPQKLAGVLKFRL